MELIVIFALIAAVAGNLLLLASHRGALAAALAGPRMQQPAQPAAIIPISDERRIGRRALPPPAAALPRMALAA